MKKYLRGFASLLLIASSAGAATYTVSSSADSGPGTFRQAILDANSDAPPNEILFTIGSPYTITLVSALPAITNRVDINAMAGHPHPTVFLDGSSAGSGARGLQIQQTAGCIIQGLRIANFSSDGIQLYQSDSNVIQRCTIYSNDYGVLIRGGSFNLIGGNTALQKNTLSANVHSGIRVDNASISNQISGNYIGTDEEGIRAWANGSSGVYLYAGSHTLVGGENVTPGGLFPGNLRAVSLPFRMNSMEFIALIPLRMWWGGQAWGSGTLYLEIITMGFIWLGRNLAAM